MTDSTPTPAPDLSPDAPAVSGGLPTKPIRVADLDLAMRTMIEAIDTSAALERLVDYREFVVELAAKARDWKRGMDDRLIEAMEHHGSPEHPAQIQIGQNRYYVGQTKKVRPRRAEDGKVDDAKVAAILEALLDATDGDLEAVAKCLGADPFKQALVRGWIGDQKHAELFETDVQKDVKTGKPKRGLKTSNDQFNR